MKKQLQLKVRISNEEKELYSDEARKRGFNLSNFIRYCIRKEISLKDERLERKL